MMSLDDILAHYAVQRLELEAWIQEQWVQPRRENHGYAFDAADQARVGLICELRHDLSVNEEAIPLILSLLDELYATRQVLRDVDEALRALPAPLRRQLHGYLQGDNPD